MPLKPSDLEIHEKAMELKEKIRETFRELEEDMIFLAKNPILDVPIQLKNKWQERAAKLQEAKT